MDDITVHHHGDDEFAVLVRDDLIHAGQPIEAGGGDAGPTPTELFVASLAACVAFYAQRHLARHGLPADGLEVTAASRCGSRRRRRCPSIAARR